MELLFDRHIEITPDTRGGKPRIAGTRIAVADIVILHRRLGYGVEEIAGTYDLPLPRSPPRIVDSTAREVTKDGEAMSNEQ